MELDMKKRLLLMIMTMLALLFCCATVLGSDKAVYHVKIEGRDIQIAADLSGGELADAGFCVTSLNGKSAKLNRPQKTGYTFKSWQYSYVNQTGKAVNKNLNAINIKGYESMKQLTGKEIPEIKAVFSENIYKVQFKAVAPEKGIKLIKNKNKKLKNIKLRYESDTMVYPDSDYISAKGYVFAGWTRDERAKKEPVGGYALEQAEKSLAGKTKKDNKVVLYSVWKKAETPSAAPTLAPSDAPTGVPSGVPAVLPKEPAEPTNYLYVSKAAAAGGDGSPEKPFDSIEEALDAAKGGTCIYLRGGKYSEQVFIEKSGSKDKYIYIKGYPGEKAEVTLPAGKSGAIFELSDCSNIVISDLVIGDITGKEVYGICMYANVHDVFVLNNEIKNIVTTKSSGDGEANAILCFGEGATKEKAISDIYIVNNKVHDNVNGWSENISVADNCENVYVIGNLVYDCTNIGIDFCGNQGYCRDPLYDYPRYCYAFNNTVYNCVCGYAECAGIYADGASFIEISGNTVYANQYGIEIGAENPFKVPEAAVREVKVHDNYIHNNTVCGIILGGYTEDSKTGVVTSTYIYENRLVNNAEKKNLSNGEICFEKCDGIIVKNNKIQRDEKDAPFIGSQMSGKYVKNIKLSGNTYYGCVEAEEIVFELPVGEGLDTITGIESLNALDFAADEKYVKGSIE